MTVIEKQTELHNKITLRLEKVHEKMVEFKKQKKSDLVILQDNEIVQIKP